MTSSLPPPVPHPTPRLPRHAALAAAVVLLHAGGLYALQTGLLQRAVEIVVPVQVLAQFIEPAQPKVEPPAPPPPQPPPKVKPQPVQQKPQPVPLSTPLPPPPMPLAVPSAQPSPNAVTGATTPQPPAPPIAAPVSEAPSVSPAPPAPPAPPRIQLPDSNADYLNNRPPVYPPLSRRLGEQGQVVVRVFIGTDGKASRAELRTSSGFDRLDQAALRTAQEWTYVPGKVNGEPKAMWFNVPIRFVLE